MTTVTLMNMLKACTIIIVVAAVAYPGVGEVGDSETFGDILEV